MPASGLSSATVVNLAFPPRRFIQPEKLTVRFMATMVLIGEGALALHCLRSLASRGLMPAWTCSLDGSLAEACTQLGIAHLADRREVAVRLAADGCDCLFSVRNPWVIPSALLDHVRRVAVNFHDSLLPRYAGLHATSWALLQGEREHGVSWHEMSAGIDEGRLLVQAKVAISEQDTAFTLNTKCFDAAVQSFDDLLDALQNERLTPRDQSGERSYFGAWARPAAQCLLDLTLPAHALADQVRALDFGPVHNPLGLAKLWLGEGQGAVAVLSAQALSSRSGAWPGTLLACDAASLRVATGTVDLLLSRLSSLDGEPLSAAQTQALFASRVTTPLPSLGAEERARVSLLNEQVCRHEAAWLQRLTLELIPAVHPYASGVALAPLCEVPLPSFSAMLMHVAPALRLMRALSAIAVYLVRIGRHPALDLGLVKPDVMMHGQGLFAPVVPLHVDARAEQPFQAFEATFADAWTQVLHLNTFAKDLCARAPGLHGRRAVPARWPVAMLVSDEMACQLDAHAAMVFWLSRDGSSVQLLAPQGMSPALIEALDRQLSTLARAAIDEPLSGLSKLPLLDEAERERLLVTWNQTVAPIPDACVHELFEQQAQRTPDAPAVRFGKTRISYSELDARANQLAHLLVTKGVRPDELVALSVGRSVELIVGMLGILKAGAAYVPIDASYPSERIRLMLARSRPAVIVTDAAARLALSPADGMLLCLDDEPALAAQPCSKPTVQVRPDHLVYVIFTSGSTGEPKGVEIAHWSLVNHGVFMAGRYALGPGDRMLCSASISFDVAAEQIYPALFSGAEVVMRPDDLLESFQRFDSFVRELELSALTLPTAFWHEWVRELDGQKKQVPPSLRVLAVGTEKALGEHLALWRKRGGDKVLFLQGYGPTEATVTCTMYVHDGGDVNPTRQLPIGRALPNTDIYVLDEQLEPVPVGIDGELYVGGIGLARGYLGRPDLTQERFIPHPFRSGDGMRLYKTGDVVRYEPDGQLMYVGRSDFQVKVRGFRIELGDVEAALRLHPAVNECVVLLREDTPGARQLVAYVVLHGDNADTAAIDGFCRERLPEYMLPAAYMVVPAFALTSNGKVDRRALPAPAGPARRLVVLPRDAVEQAVARAFCDVLGLAEVGVNESFFDLGGDSLRAVRLLESLHRTFAQQLALQTLFSNPTVEAVAECIGQGGTADLPSVIQLKQGEGVPLFLVSGFHIYQHLARSLRGTNPVYSVLLPIEAALLRSGEPFPCLQEFAALYIETVRKHTPCGPYALAGISFGGVIAYEMARVLAQQGEHIQVLAMFDAILPRARQRDPLAWLGKMSKRLVRSLCRAAGVLNESAASLEMERLEALRDREIKRLLKRYDKVVQPYGGDAVLYRALHSNEGPVIAGHGFNELVQGELSVCDIPGDHLGMLGLENVGTVAIDLDHRLGSTLPRQPSACTR
jgi:amino acid adenylation domain-containing protein